MSTPSNTSHRLGRDDFLHLPDEPVCLFAERGTLWVTEDGEPDDIQLDAGRWHRFDGHAAVTVGTLGGEALVRVTRHAPARGAWARAAVRWLTRLPGLQAGRASPEALEEGTATPSRLNPPAAS